MTQPNDTQPPGKPIADDIPTATAWKTGRRIYIRCGYQSQLNEQLREIGAKWDKDTKALWVGSGKFDKALPLIQAHMQRIASAVAVKRAAHWVTIPYDADTIRAKAKQLGGIFDGPTRRWAMPTPEALAEIDTLLTARAKKIDDERRARYAAEKQAEADERAAARKTAAENAAAREARVIADSGRTIRDTRGTERGLIVGYMRRPDAEAAKPKPGTIRHHSNGRRALVLSSEVEFWSQDMIDDGLTDGGTGDEPGWRYFCRWVEVEPTAEEAEADRIEAEQEADQETIDRLVREVAKTVTKEEVGPGSPRIPAGSTITLVTGTMYGSSYDRITLTRDGQGWYYHPGWYDDYRATQGQITDEGIIARVRAVIAGGTRKRGRYEVTVLDDTKEGQSDA